MKNKVKFALLLPILLIAASAFAQEVNRKIPPKGSVFNESVWMVDSVTGRPTLRLTQNRDYIRTPSYHLNACFSEDSRYVFFSTSSAGYGSAIIKADVTNGDCQVIAVRGPKEKNFSENLCVIYKTDYVASASGGKVMIYNLKTLEEKELYNAPKGNMLSQVTGSADGRKVYFNELPNDGDKGDLATNRMSVVEIDIASGRSQVVFSDTSRGKHVVANPVNLDLLLIDRDFPPRFSRGGDGKTSRVWILNIKTGALTECRPNNSSRFQIHSNWSHDGKYVYYHGVTKKNNAHYIGVADLDGKVVWEGTFPYFHYGHICTHTQKHALFTDGLLFPNLITELDWTKPDKNNVPPVLIYGAHNSGSYKFGQHAHPHCHMSPDAQKITYNKGSEKRSDVYILFTDQAAKNN